jgi:hypothetical protein
MLDRFAPCTTVRLRNAFGWIREEKKSIIWKLLTGRMNVLLEYRNRNRKLACKKVCQAITTSSSISYKKRASIEIMLALSLFMVAPPRVELGTNGL